jgi:catechol 2,3-dioxygenase-like lactoylglutathione lyase family enzyme
MQLEYTEAFAAIGANHYAETVDFYRAVFGREPDERIRDIYVAFHLPGLKLGIFEPRAENRPEFENPTDAHSSLNLVLRVPSVERARAELAARRPRRPPGEICDTNHGREFYAYDPEGNRLILVERTSAK